MLWLYLICVPFKPDVISELKLQGVWEHITHQRVPGIDVLGKYKLIFWYADDYAQPYIRDVVDDIQTYLNAGGKLILSSWQGIRNMLGGTYPYGFDPSDWLYGWWGIDLSLIHIS